MRKVGGNDTIEMWGHELNNTPHVAWHDRRALDNRAKLLIELVKMWSHMLPMAEIMREAHEQPHHKQSETPSIQSVVMRAADAVDAIYDEADRRGWIIDLPPYDELIAP